MGMASPTTTCVNRRCGSAAGAFLDAVKVMTALNKNAPAATSFKADKTVDDRRDSASFMTLILASSEIIVKGL